MQQQLLL